MMKGALQAANQAKKEILICGTEPLYSNEIRQKENAERRGDEKANKD